MKTFMKVFGILAWVLGFFMGIVLSQDVLLIGRYGVESGFSVETLFSIWGTYFISGMIFYAIGVILDKLDMISIQVNKMTYRIAVSEPVDGKAAPRQNMGSPVSKATAPIKDSIVGELLSSKDNEESSEVGVIRINIGDGKVQCPACGFVQNNTRNECWKCGQKFAAEESLS
jgi:hypothetical protein